MAKRLATAATAVLVATVGSIVSVGAAAPTASGAATSCQRGTFHNFHDEGQPGGVPPGYTGPTFKLSQDYPDQLPADGAYPWEAVAVHGGAPSDPQGYLDALRAYAFEGNRSVDFVVQKNSTRSWFHAPWLDVSADGREFVHGLTHELDSAPGSLDPQHQTDTAQTWAVGFYNPAGGYAFGRVWCHPDRPDPSQLGPGPTAPNSFPNGTMVFKLLFSTISDEQAPFMRGAFTWTADIFTNIQHNNPDNPNNGGDPPRSLQSVRLIQVDLAVRDDRLKNGWAFGTLAYDSTGSAPSASSSNPFDKLVPLGLQWGNDPGVSQQMVDAGMPLREQWINTAASKNLVSDHLGYAGRLVGPLDSRVSSCMSCHQTAGVPGAPLIPEAALPPGAQVPTPVRLAWFQDVPAGVPFADNQAYSLDYSLQLSIGFQRFFEARCDRRSLFELFSARGPQRAAPELVASKTCRALAALAGPKPGKTPYGLAGALLVVGLVVGFAAAITIRARR